MASVDWNINLDDSSSTGAGPFNLSVRKNATAPADGTEVLADTSLTSNTHELVARSYQTIADLIVNLFETDPDN